MQFGLDGRLLWSDPAWQRWLLLEIMRERLSRCQPVDYSPVILDGKVYFTFSVCMQIELTTECLAANTIYRFNHAGTIGCIWFLFWVLIVKEGPEKDKHISKDELQYIQKALGPSTKTDVKHPWKDIFTSKPVYAIAASHFAENWGFYTLLTQLPTFLKGTEFTSAQETTGS